VLDIGLGVQFPGTEKLELEDHKSTFDIEEYFLVERPETEDDRMPYKHRYASCYELTMNKALCTGFTEGYIISVYRSSLEHCMDIYLKHSGQAVTQFKGELGWWRDLCTSLK
jgi:hypothetical protein